ncbi:MAG: FAD:protein FMN transferase [Pseudomonadota bacterium]|nr:FAD:protein FMN transferase [Pseudomonadota bacterium]
MKISRAKPLLGTLVEISVAGLDEDAAHRAIDRGFAAVAEIHALMSFHDAGSDVSRLNAQGFSGVRVDPHTRAVLLRAQEIAEHSDGLFDVTAAARLVCWGLLPAPATRSPDPAASWRDVVVEEDVVRFLKPLWIDLGGIAKGYAVDRAVIAMDLPAHVQAVVNAGGDLRVAGPHAEPVLLRSALITDAIPVVEIADGALASSSGREHQRPFHGSFVGPHVGRGGISVGAQQFVSVAAHDCSTADALTKVVLAAGMDAQPILGRFGAIAYFYDAGAGWVTLR